MLICLFVCLFLFFFLYNLYVCLSLTRTHHHSCLFLDLPMSVLAACFLSIFFPLPNTLHHSLTHLVTHLFTHSHMLARSRTHSLTHSLTLSLSLSVYLSSSLCRHPFSQSRLLFLPLCQPASSFKICFNHSFSHRLPHSLTN